VRVQRAAVTPTLRAFSAQPSRRPWARYHSVANKSPSCLNLATSAPHLADDEFMQRICSMRIWSTLLVAAPVAAGLLAAPAAQADWHGHQQWHGGDRHGDWHHEDHGNGAGVAAAVLGLGAAAILGGVIASQQQPSYYAPPPPVVYAPPPGYYAAPGYYSQY
jgi:hypothetical protein